MVPEFLWDVLARIGITAIIVIDVLFIYAAIKVAGDADRRMNKED